MELKLTNCVIRNWRPDDRVTLAKHANNREIWKTLTDHFPHPYTLAHADQWIATSNSAHPVTHFAIEVNHEAVGGIGLVLENNVYRRSAGIGYWLSQNYWGRGIMTEALKAMVEYAFTHFDIRRLYAEVFESNTASRRVLEKAGFAQEARLRKAITKDGHTMDEFIYAIVR